MQKGFTLIELLITIVLVAVLAVIAMPSFKSLITGNRMASEINDFTAGLHLTRTEAVKRGEMVLFCSAQDASQTICEDDTITEWKYGWIIKVRSTDEVIKTSPPLSADRLTDLYNDGIYGFNRFGFAPGEATTIRLCDPSNDNHNARGVILTTSGRIILASDRDDPADRVRNDSKKINLNCG